MAQPPVLQSCDAADPAFWNERFAREHIPWNVAGVPTAFRRFCGAQPASLSVLIPDCGNACEVDWLAGRGWPITAIDFAPSVVASAGAMLSPYTDVVRPADSFRSSPFRPVYWIYERAFLCAMPRRLWPGYATQVAKLLPPRKLLTGSFAMVKGREATSGGLPFEAIQPGLNTLLSPAFKHISDVPIAEADSVPVLAGRERWQVWRHHAD